MRARSWRWCRAAAKEADIPYVPMSCRAEPAPDLIRDPASMVGPSLRIKPGQAHQPAMTAI
jgi:hypothetical protein